MELQWVEMTSKITFFYNPITSSYYRPPDFCLDEPRPTITNFPNSFQFDGGITCGLLQNKTEPIHELFMKGTRVLIQHEDSLV